MSVFGKQEIYSIVGVTGGDAPRVNEERNDAYGPMLKAARSQPLSYVRLPEILNRLQIRQKGYYYV